MEGEEVHLGRGHGPALLAATLLPRGVCYLPVCYPFQYSTPALGEA